MKTVVQRVTRARVLVEGEVVGDVEAGVLALVGVERGDTAADAVACANKIASLRIFRGTPEAQGGSGKPMDRSLRDVGGSALVVSQFTLAATVTKGRRPSMNAAEDPALASPLVDKVCDVLREHGIPVQTGRFGASMQVELTNDGPVTLLVSSMGGVLC